MAAQLSSLFLVATIQLLEHQISEVSIRLLHLQLARVVDILTLAVSFAEDHRRHNKVLPLMLQQHAAIGAIFLAKMLRAQTFLGRGHKHYFETGGLSALRGGSLTLCRGEGEWTVYYGLRCRSTKVQGAGVGVGALGFSSWLQNSGF